MWHVPDVNGSIRFFHCQHFPICYLGLGLPIPVCTVHMRCGYLYLEDVWIKCRYTTHNTHTATWGRGRERTNTECATGTAERPGTSGSGPGLGGWGRSGLGARWLGARGSYGSWGAPRGGGPAAAKGHSKKKVTDLDVYLIKFRGTNQPPIYFFSSLFF
jgi:hypothetical protein